MSITQISKIQVKTGVIDDLPQLDVGEFGFATDTRRLFIGNDPALIPPPISGPNVTEILTNAVNGFAAGGNTQVQYNVSGLLGASPNFTYNYTTNTLCTQNFKVTGQTQLGSISNVCITGGSNGQVLSTNGAGGLSWQTIATGVSSLNSLTGAVTLAAGTNVAIGAVGNTLTICSTTTVNPATPTALGTVYGSTCSTNNNTFLGYQAGNSVTTGTCNTILGSLTGSSGLSDTVLIGAGATERIKADSTGLYINNSGAGSAITLRNTYESLSTITGATGVVVHNFSLGSVFVHNSIVSNFTVNVTNLSLSSNYVTNLVLILNQSSIAYIPNAFQINGSAQTITWLYGNLPSGNIGAKDVVCFSIINVGGVYTVFGQLITYS